MKVSSFAQRLCGWLTPKNIDDDFLESYRKLLFSQYASLSNPVNNPGAKAEADRIYHLNPKEVDWDDLYQLELAIVKLESPDSLRNRIWILRNEYKEVASAQELKDYISSNPPDPKTADEAAVRADAVTLQEELNWRYVVMWVFESFRSNLIKSLARAAALMLLFTLVFIFLWNYLYSLLAAININVPIIMMIVVPGILGGLVSTLQRVQKARLSSNADVDLSELEEGKTGIYLSPLLGGVFALLLFLLFAGGFMSGSTFPKVSFDDLVPSEGAVLDYAETAKLIVWCFIAGFAERLVPDRLEQFTENANGAKTQKTNSAN